MIQHGVLYIPGLGDKDISGRQDLLSLWRYKDSKVTICPMDWTIDEPWQIKLDKLLRMIDELHEQGMLVSLIGESAGATAAIQALIQKTEKVHKVILLCGKSQFPERVAPVRYQTNPAFKDALFLSSAAVSKLTPEQKKKMLNLHPLVDMVVPVKESMITGVQNAYMPIVGHAVSIIFANIFWKWRIIKFLRQPK